MTPVDSNTHVGNESPPLRSTILGSFLRGRPRNSSQSHINTDPPPPPRELSPSPPASPNPVASNRRRPAGGAVQTSTSHQATTTNSSAGLGLSNMLRRRRSAGTLAATPAAAGAPPANLAMLIGIPATSAPSQARPHTSGTAHRIRMVPHLESRRSLRFEAIGRDLKEGESALRIGRFTDRSGMGLAAVNAINSNKLAFKSKVVSRAHAEVWVESGGRFFIKDTKSSSGTFLNHVRLSPANTESRPHQIKDGDILQLGVDYQGGAEDIYKSVKIRIEIGREWQAGANAFNTTALKNLKTLSVAPSKSAGTAPGKPAGKSSIPDCCICLFGVTIRQALFIAPCSHTFHYKCIRPLLEAHHPAFSCPLCRTYADLEEDVELEADADALDDDDSSAIEDSAAAVELLAGAAPSRPTTAAANGHDRETAGAETEVEGEAAAPGGSSARARRVRTSQQLSMPLGDLAGGPGLEEEDEGDLVMEDDEMINLGGDTNRADDLGLVDMVMSGGPGVDSEGSGSGRSGEGGVVGMMIDADSPAPGEMGEADDCLDADGTVGGKRKR